MADPDNSYFRREAAEAQRRAGIAKNENDRDIWLRIARDWLALIKPDLDSEGGLTITIALPTPEPPIKH